MKTKATPAEKLAAKQFRALVGAGPNAAVRPYLDSAYAGKPERIPSNVCPAVPRAYQHGEQVRVYVRDWNRAVFQAAAHAWFRP
jgi:hypothetical protein